MSMPNRCCVNERRLDIIEQILGIEIPIDLLNLPGDINKEKYQEKVTEFVSNVKDNKVKGGKR